MSDTTAELLTSLKSKIETLGSMSQGGADNQAIASLIDRSITQITIPDEITQIGTGAFLDCASLESVTIPNSVTSIGSQSFQSCKSLKSITMPKNVASIGVSAFAYCTSLASVTIPEGIEQIGQEAFRNCSSLESITIPKSTTNIGYSAFGNCKVLKNVTIEFVELKNKIDRMFGNCTSLENVTLPDGFNTNNLDLSVSTLYSEETLVAILNALADRTGETAYTLKLGETNLAKLSEEQIAVATEKNWTIA